MKQCGHNSYTDPTSKKSKNTTKKGETIKGNLNDIISLTGFVKGRSMKREFVKNSSLRLASRFLGIFAAESLMVSSEYNLLTSALYELSNTKGQPKRKLHLFIERKRMPIYYQLRIFGPLHFGKQATFSPSFRQKVPCIIIFSGKIEKKIVLFVYSEQFA